MSADKPMTDSPQPVSTRAEPIKDTLFGVEVKDPYRWLENEKSEEVRAWMTAQDAYARKQLQSLPGRDALAARLKTLFYVDSISAPSHKGGRYFYSRTHADKEKAILYWREGENGAENLLLDPNQLSADGSTSLGVSVASYDGKWLAYALRKNNSDEATLHLMDVKTLKVSDTDVIDGAKYAQPSWTPSGDGFYYVRLPVDPKIPVADRPGYAEVYFHKLGESAKADTLIHPKTGNPQQFLGVELSRDGHFLFVVIQNGWNSNDVYFRDLRSPDKTFRPLVAGVPSIFNVEAWQDRFYIMTNEAAPHYRVMVADPAHPARGEWKEIVSESKDSTIENVQVIGGHLVLTRMQDASSRLEVRGLDGKKLRDVSLPGIGASTGMTGNPIDDTAYFAFTSFTQPLEIFKTSIQTGATSLWASVKLPIDPTPYTVEQVFYPSKDGTRVSMFLVHRKDLKKDGSTPFLLYGYGGFNINLLPAFAGSIYPWLEAGGGYAVPNLRGGGEYGEAWHKAGMLDKKQNTFDDYLAAAEWLVKNGYTKSSRLAIRGGSNGGLLVGAAMTQRPDLFRAVVCAVPLLDMVRFHLFGSGKTWVPEYGSAETESGFRPLFAYSPYHHVKPQTAYPALLMLSADSDDRVDPLHARKFTAAVQAATNSGHPVWLRIEKHAGHGGADLVKQQVEVTADNYAFLMHELGLTPPTTTKK